jgi:hypothetical protein
VYCGRHFYQLTETRTYCPDNIWELPIDDLVSTPAVAATVQVNLDYNGTGVYSTAWGNPAPPISTGTNYVLTRSSIGSSQMLSGQYVLVSVSW